MNIQMKVPGLAALLLLAAATGLQSAERPNIVVVFTDDHGYSDLSSQGVYEDVETPHIDALAEAGARMTDGYASAPQCVPSRAGLLSGRYQNRFGLETNRQGKDAAVMRRFGDLQTVAERLQAAGYATGMAGKWHLGPADEIADHGFDQVFHKNGSRPGYWNMDLDGKDVEPGRRQGEGYHLDLVADFACAFIERYRDRPFYFYLPFRAPHVPLDAPKRYLDRFPGEMPERRRQALAMLSAVDDGVGRVVATLRENDLEENTLIFVVGDNGAPLKIHKRDAPGGGPGWDGSLNDPMNGEKGMLAEGGIRTPFVASWKGVIPGGRVYSHPVTALDTTATALALAGLEDDPQLDGVNLIPYLSGDRDGAPHEALFWRWNGQAAIRKGQWKYLRGYGREYLFDMEADAEEQHNLISDRPEMAKGLLAELTAWTGELSPPGLGDSGRDAGSRAGRRYFDWYLDGKRDGTTAKVEPKRRPARRRSQRVLFARRDENRDGEVTWREFLAGRGGDKIPALKKHFKTRDRNGNGVWEQSEIVGEGEKEE